MRPKRLCNRLCHSFWKHRSNAFHTRLARRAYGRSVFGSSAFEALEARLPLTGAPEIESVWPRMGSINVDPAVTPAAQFSLPMDAATINEATIELKDHRGRLVPIRVTYDAVTQSVALDPFVNLPLESHYFTVTVKAGPEGVLDETGNELAADFQWSFSSGAPLFDDTLVWEGITAPTAVRFAADGRVFVAQQSGRILVFDSLDDTEPDLFADLHVNVHNFWDRGLLGMALAPNFPQDPYVYVLYTYDGDIPGTSPGGMPAQAAPKFGNGVDLADEATDPVGKGAWASARLSRLTASGNSTVGEEEVLIHDWPQQFPSHSVGTLAFGPDGALYVSAGDGASFVYADYGQPVPPDNPGDPFGSPENEGGALRAQDLRTPDDPTSLNGAVIRVNPDTGEALPDNPLFDVGTDENARRIIAYGLRNPYRFTVRPGTDELWIGDVGWYSFEEINRIVSPTDAVVENFGWPAYEGHEPESLYAELELPLLEELYAGGAEAVTWPYYAYAQFQNVDPDAPETTSFSAITGLAFPQGGNFPAAFDGALLFTDFARNAIWAMYRGVDGLPDPTNVRALVAPAQSPVDLVFAPDGNLYYPDYFGSSIRRVSFVAPYEPPGFTGTESADDFVLRASNDGVTLEIYDNNEPAGEPLFSWPMSVEVPLFIDTLGGDDVITIELPQEASGPAGGIRLDAGAGANRLQISGGLIHIDATAVGGSMEIDVQNGSELVTSGFDRARLTLVDAGSNATILPTGGRASVLESLVINTDTTLDITDNALVLDFSGESPLAMVREKILSGRGASGLGASWDGNGITSSAAAEANAGAPESRSIGYAENGLLPLGPYAFFRGQPVDHRSILISYTWTGDANLDGKVDDDDVTIVGANYAPGVPNANWAMGDFDYNGFIDDDDVTLLGAFYQPPTVAANEVQRTKDEIAAAPLPSISRGGMIGAELPAATQPDVMARAPHHASSVIAALPAFDLGEGHEDVRGRESFAQQLNPAQQPQRWRIAAEGDEALGDRDGVINLLAEIIARNVATGGTGSSDTGLALRQARDLILAPI